MAPRDVVVKIGKLFVNRIVNKGHKIFHTATVHKKNWLPFVLGPAFAMLKMPGPVCFTENKATNSAHI